MITALGGFTDRGLFKNVKLTVCHYHSTSCFNSIEQVKMLDYEDDLALIL